MHGRTPNASTNADAAPAPGPEVAAFLSAFVPRALAESPRADRARRGRDLHFPGVPDAEWYDWRWQLRNRVTTLDELARRVPFPASERPALGEVLRDFRMGVTPYWLSLIDPARADDPLLRQVVPHADEHVHGTTGDEDPLAEEGTSPVPGIVHRYPDRCLMVVSNVCAVYCRYCTRKRIMYEDAVPELDLAPMLEYIARTPAIRDVIVSGGDPLAGATARIEKILAGLRAIPHVEIVRIGTRVPSALPMRVTDELCATLARFHPLWVNVHFNHPDEITPDAARACDKLIRAGIPLNNQAVLLRGVNDSADVMRDLVHGLMQMRVRPYYLYVCDPVRGAAHFRTSVAKGVEIIEALRGHTSGLAVPQLVVDAPGGGGKVPVNPQYVLGHRDGTTTLRNWQGRTFEYADPSDDGSATSGDAASVGSSTWVRRRA